MHADNGDAKWGLDRALSEFERDQERNPKKAPIKGKEDVGSAYVTEKYDTRCVLSMII